MVSERDEQRMQTVHPVPDRAGEKNAGGSCTQPVRPQLSLAYQWCQNCVTNAEICQADYQISPDGNFPPHSGLFGRERLSWRATDQKGSNFSLTGRMSGE